MCKSRVSRKKPGFFYHLRRRRRLHQRVWRDEKTAFGLAS
jgi:hypothetical protein